MGLPRLAKQTGPAGPAPDFNLAHRSYMTDFIRDPRTGGCAAGVPPANLGFRLVVEPRQSFAASAVRNVAKLLRRT